MKVLGITCCVLGGFSMLISFVLGLPKLMGSDFQDAQSFSLKLSKAPLTTEITGLSIPKNVELGLWLKVPGRQIETQNITISVRLVQRSQSPEVVLSKAFGSWHTRSGSGQGQYYKIGSHRFMAGFDGDLLIGVQGDWRPVYDGKLVLTATKESLMERVLPYLGIFVSAVLVLVTGLLLLSKPSVKQKNGSV